MVLFAAFIIICILTSLLGSIDGTFVGDKEGCEENKLYAFVRMPISNSMYETRIVYIIPIDNSMYEQPTSLLGRLVFFFFFFRKSLLLFLCVCDKGRVRSR